MMAALRFFWQFSQWYASYGLLPKPDSAKLFGTQVTCFIIGTLISGLATGTSVATQSLEISY